MLILNNPRFKPGARWQRFEGHVLLRSIAGFGSFGPAALRMRWQRFLYLAEGLSPRLLL